MVRRDFAPSRRPKIEDRLFFGITLLLDLMRSARCRSDVNLLSAAVCEYIFTRQSSDSFRAIARRPVPRPAASYRATAARDKEAGRNVVNYFAAFDL